ncbi:DNA/RNA polymerases superfamily protein [Gossypium australe]|uniref:DNA/RNA polymerases superfamily protein n=1 Tax=Gossypium australe TaxID=47621 RepID=A0A5B6W869_9ROSI|nr:DNA/RNA polymerases superfamily protein [Gossypium australe]
MLWCCIIEFEGSWERYLLLAKFTYNNNYQSSIKMALYKALYRRKCRSPLYWSELIERKIAGVDIEFSVGEKVFLKVLPWKKVLRFDRKGKLNPRFIRPYEVVENRTRSVSLGITFGT